MQYFFTALHERDIKWDSNPQTGTYCACLEQEDPGHPFDFERLGYLAVHDVLTDEQKLQFGHLCPHGDVRSYKYEELPDEVKIKVNERKEDIRRQFTEFIIEISADPEYEWPDFIQGPLDRAFQYQEES